MNNDDLKKPWYFILPGVVWLIYAIGEVVLGRYFPDELIDEFLGLSITIKWLLPIGLVIVTAMICLGIYIAQLHKKMKKNVTPTELEELTKILKESINNYEYIESIQAYQFWNKNDSESPYVKVCYLTGAADERIDINSIMQSYYYFPYSIAKKLRNASFYYDKYRCEKDPNNKSSLKKEFMRLGTEAYKSMLQTLNGIKSVEDINKYHCEFYRAVARILPLIEEESRENILDNHEIEDALIKKRKTGILGSILIDDVYTFRNQNSINKTNRVYFTFRYNRKKDIVLLVSVNQTSFTSEEESDIDSYCNQIYDELVTTFQL